jgi:hypothetical protein
MTGLTTFAALQARVYEFLEQQDEATLRAIVDGTARLAVAGADAAQRPVAPPSRPVPTDDPVQAARDLSALTSEQERRDYVDATTLSVSDLRKVAKLLGLTRYSGLTRSKLVDRLAGHDAARSPAVTAPPPPAPVAVEPKTTPEVPSPAAPTVPGVDPAAVAARLRETETEEEGAEYLRAQRLDRETLLAVAAELQLTRVDRLRQAELEKRVLKQAIGARRKFSGLRKW